MRQGCWHNVSLMLIIIVFGATMLISISVYKMYELAETKAVIIMCLVRILQYDCGHEERCLADGTCSRATGSLGDNGQLPSQLSALCSAAEAQKVRVPGNCSTASLLVNCRLLQGLDRQQLSVHAMCNKRTKEINTRLLEMARRIRFSRAKLTNNKALVDCGNSGPHWCGSSPSKYPDKETMADAAWQAYSQAQRMWMEALSGCTQRLLAIFSAEGWPTIGTASATAIACLVEVERWASRVAPELKRVADAVEAATNAAEDIDTTMQVSVDEMMEALSSMQL